MKGIEDFRRGAAWAIKPQALEVLAAAVGDYAKNAGLHNAAEEKFVEWGEDLPVPTVVDGVAVIPIEGPIFRRAWYFSRFFGGTGINVAEAKIKTALDDPAVKGILLDINSPGGVVTGTNALSEMIYAARQRKPIVAFSDGLMASAAYWIGSAADAIVIDPTAEVGSIGVVAIHADVSKMLEDYGVKLTVLRAGKYKALGNPYESLSDDAKAVIGAELDSIYQVFVSSVARNRGAEIPRVSGEMAEGKVFIGQAAVAIGLADEVGKIETAADMVRDRSAAGRKSFFTMGGAAAAKKGKKEMEIKSVADLRAAFPDFTAAIEHDARADMEAAVLDAGSEARSATIDLAAAVFGEEDGERFRAIAESGITADQYRVANPEAGKKRGDKAALEALLKISPANPGANTGGENQPEPDFEALVAEYREAKKCGRVEAMMAIAGKHPKAHQAYLRKVNRAAANE